MQTDLTEAYRRYFPLLVHKCARMLGDAAEAQDIAQETFIRFARSTLLTADARAVTAWLYLTSTRLAIDRLRVRRRETDDTALVGLLSTDSPLESVELRALLSRLLTNVPADELEAALLSRVDGLSQLELAEVMSVHERTVRRLLTRFDERLARLCPRSEA